MTPNLLIIDDFVHPRLCKALHDSLVDGGNCVTRQTTALTPNDPPVVREYKVHDGQWFQENALTGWKIYGEALECACEVFDTSLHGPLDIRSDLVGKLYEPGHGYHGWHRDINAVSGVLYLNNCIGGATIFEDMVIEPKAGRLALFRGNLLHKADHVQQGDKVNLIMNFYDGDTHERPDTYSVMLGNG